MILAKGIAAIMAVILAGGLATFYVGMFVLAFLDAFGSLGDGDDNG